jgi:hypothetical protein
MDEIVDQLEKGIAYLPAYQLAGGGKVMVMVMQARFPDSSSHA